MPCCPLSPSACLSTYLPTSDVVAASLLLFMLIIAAPPSPAPGVIVFSIKYIHTQIHHTHTYNDQRTYIHTYIHVRTSSLLPSEPSYLLLPYSSSSPPPSPVSSNPGPGPVTRTERLGRYCTYVCVCCERG